jgi:hypothetical protein
MPGPCRVSSQWPAGGGVGHTGGGRAGESGAGTKPADISLPRPGAERPEPGRTRTVPACRGLAPRGRSQGKPADISWLRLAQRPAGHSRDAADAPRAACGPSLLACRCRPATPDPAAPGPAGRGPPQASGRRMAYQPDRALCGHWRHRRSLAGWPRCVAVRPWRTGTGDGRTRGECRGASERTRTRQ